VERRWRRVRRKKKRRRKRRRKRKKRRNQRLVGRISSGDPTTPTNLSAKLELPAGVVVVAMGCPEVDGHHAGGRSWNGGAGRRLQQWKAQQGVHVVSGGTAVGTVPRLLPP
jgi:hypothetical protein